MRILASLALAALPAVAFAQGTVTASDAVAQMKERFSGCVWVLVGVHKTPPLPLLDGNQGDLVKRVVALEKAGVVTVKSVGSLSENILTVALRPDLDKAQFHPTHPNCLTVYKSFDVKRVVKIDGAEGGTAIKWSASLAYLIVEWERNRYYDRYQELMGVPSRPGLQSQKAVALFRQDPFTQKWDLYGSDFADMDAPASEMNKVAQWLRSD